MATTGPQTGGEFAFECYKAAVQDHYKDAVIEMIFFDTLAPKTREVWEGVWNRIADEINQRASRAAVVGEPTPPS